MPPQPRQPLPDEPPTGRYRGRHSAPDGHSPGGYPTGGQPTGDYSGGYPAGGYPDDYQSPYQEYQAPSPPPRQQGSGDDYPSGEYMTGAFTGGITPLAPPGNQHDLRATGSFDPANDPMSRYEQYSVYDDPKDRRRRAAYPQAGGRASRQHRGGAPTGAADVPWYRETWIVALCLAAALIIGLLLGAMFFS